MDIENRMKHDVTMTCRNDISTPMPLVREIIAAIPDDVFREEMKVLDPCVGMGNFLIGIEERLKKLDIHAHLMGIDINAERVDIAKELVPSADIRVENFLEYTDREKFDIIIANPPYAKMMQDGKRTSKNHNIFPEFITKSIGLLADGGALAFLCPTSWMSLSDRNTVAKQLTDLHMVRLDIDSGKKWFPGVGSSFSWFVCIKDDSKGTALVTGKFKRHTFSGDVCLSNRKFIPLLCTEMSMRIVDKMMKESPAFVVETSSDLHATTRTVFLRDEPDDVFRYKCVHTRRQTKWSSRPHKYHAGLKVFVCLSSTYETWIDECGMTQSVAFVRCKNMSHAHEVKNFLDSLPVRFAVGITRYGNFANIRVLQRLSLPTEGFSKEEERYMEYVNHTHYIQLPENIEISCI